MERQTGMATRRSALGRGLDALIPGRPDADSAESASAPDSNSALLDIAVGEIRPNPDQPRRRFDDAELERLAQSLREHGLLQPIVVRRAASGFELVVGERRLRAAQRAGLPTIRAVIADVAPPDRLELALVENVQRHDLNAIELAQAFRSLTDSGWTQEEIGRRVGFDRSSVSNHLRLLDLAPELQQDVEAERLQFGHARALLAVADPTRRRALRDRIVRDSMTVRQTEAAARVMEPGSKRARKGRSAPPRGVDADAMSLASQLRGELKTQVRLRHDGKGGGRIEIDFSSAAELHRIASAILAP